MRLSLLLLLPCLFFSFQQGICDDDRVTKIIFGSCIKQDKPMPIFETIAAEKPDVLLFLGDNIYGDTNDMDELRSKYRALGKNPHFKKAVLPCPTVMATWDDHDYGMNDSGADYAMRKESQAAFLDFWGDKDNSSRRSREGVYESRILGPKGQQVQIILLDVRYFRGPLKTGEKRTGGKYYPDDDASIPMLGEAQWKWLEEELKKPADVRLIGSGIQIVPEAAGQETWSNLPGERQRLFDLIAKTKANGVIFLSGDRHWAELSCATESTPYPLYDFTSSSFNQIHPRGTPTDNRFRVSESTYHRENYGEITFVWKKKDPEIHLRLLDINGKAQFRKMIPLSTLSAK